MQWDLLIKDSEAQRYIANLSKANKDLEKSNKEIRLEMARLEAQGKKNSEEWKGLQDVMKKNNAEISNNTQLIKANENQLGTQNMTMNQLKKRYQELLKEMNNTSKATDPKAWESLKSQLDETKGAMSNLAGGTQKAEGVMISWGSAMKIGLMGALAGLGQKILSVLGDIFSLEKIIDSTQTTGDNFRATMAGLENAFSQFRLSIATMDFSNFMENLKEAYRVAAEATAQLDELFERQNSFKIQDIKVQAEIEDLYEVTNNVNNSFSEMQLAAQKIRELTKSQAALQTDIYAQEADAYKKLIKNRTTLNDEQLEYYIDEFNKNRDIINQARKLIFLEDEVNRVKNIGSSQSAAGDARSLQATKEYDQAKKNLELYEATNAAQIDGIKQVAQIARGYDRANDEFIRKYVDSRTKMMSVDVEAERSLRRVDKRINAMTKNISEEALRRQKEISQKSKQEQERLYKEENEAIKKTNNDKLNSIKELYQAGHMTQISFKNQSEALEEELIKNKIAINIKYSKETEDLQNQLLQKQIERIEKFRETIKTLQKEAEDKLKKNLDESDKSISSGLNSEIEESLSFMSKAAETATKVIDGQKEKLTKQKELYDADLLALTDSLELKMLTQQQYEQAVDKLNKDSWKERFEINSEGAKKVIAIILEGLNIASQVSSQLQEIETTRLETQKNKELALYGNSSEKRAEIEQEFEEKKLKIQQKYADIDMGIKIAQALASGAQGAMTAIAQLGTFAGPAIAVIAGMTALQVATIVAQRNAIKSRSGVSSGPSSGGSAERTLIGSSQQQSTSQIQIPRAQQPTVGNGINAINNMQEEIKNKERAALGELKPLIGTLDKVSGLLESLRDNPISANVVLSQFEAKTKQRDRIRKEGSL